MLLSENKLDILKKRALTIQKVRSYFSLCGYLEIDVPHLNKYSSIDRHIDSIECLTTSQETGYLHTSPEFLLKRLLAEGMDKIYFLGHVFRKGEIGKIHNPEFTMIEWYQKNISFENFLKELISLLHLFLPSLPVKIYRYKDLFSTFLGIEMKRASSRDLFLWVYKQDPQFLPEEARNWDKDTLLQLILSHFIEPHLGDDHFAVVKDFPASQAALSQITCDEENEKVSARFEIYHKGIELSNGYHELTDRRELRKRFEEENRERVSLKKASYELDEKFLAATEKIGNCYGVSLGFDRMFMLQENASSIEEILPFSWETL